MTITDYGAFVELEPGVEGLVHVFEMSWTKKNVHPGKIVSTVRRWKLWSSIRIWKSANLLGLKQCFDNPWTAFVETFPVGAEVEGEVKNITEFGLFIGLDGDIDGMATFRTSTGKSLVKKRSQTRRATRSGPRC